jgi:hypothetical protein
MRILSRVPATWRFSPLISVYKANRHPGHRAAKGDVADGQRGRGSDDRQRFEQVFPIGAQRGENDLHLVDKPLGEERAEWSVHQAGDEDGLVAGPPLAPLEAARDATGGVEPFFKINCQWKEIDAGSWLFGHGGRCQQNRIAIANRDRAVGLSSQDACLDCEGAPTKFGGEYLRAIEKLHKTS